MTNQSNIEDSSLAWIIFFFCLFVILFDLYRLGWNIILYRNAREGARGHLVRIFMVTLSILYPINIFIRTLNHFLNNFCIFFLPLAFLIIFLLQASLLVYQTQAIIPTFYDNLMMRWRNQLGLLYALIMLCLAIPSLIFSALAWGFQAAQPFSGVCTYRGGGIDVGGYSAWIIAVQTYEALFVVINIIVEIQLRRTRIHTFIKEELLILTRLQLFVLVWDVIFRFSFVQRLIALSDDANGVKIGTQIYNMCFLASYIFVMGASFALALNRSYFRFIPLSGLSARWWKLLFGAEQFTDSEQDRIAAYRRLNQKKHIEEAKEMLLLNEPIDSVMGEKYRPKYLFPAEISASSTSTISSSSTSDSHFAFPIGDGQGLPISSPSVVTHP